MRHFYDTEFIEDGRTIDLISIGIVAEDGREYYAVNFDFQTIQAAVEHDWLRRNVVPHLPVLVDYDSKMNKEWWTWDTGHPDYQKAKPRNQIRQEVREFLLTGGTPELWAWYAAYDHVALCQLWGNMIELPKGLPMHTNDIKQECDRLGNPQLPEQPEGEHNALADARHNKVRFDFLAARSA